MIRSELRHAVAMGVIGGDCEASYYFPHTCAYVERDMPRRLRDRRRGRELAYRTVSCPASTPCAQCVGFSRAPFRP